jgi:hypothetical protein
MSRFFRKNVEVLNHWISFVDGFQITPGDFYTKLKQKLTERNIPKMEVSEINIQEGGLLSEKRVYLRMLRERFVFDVCAAPFGNGFFFSCRTSEIPLVLRIYHLVLVLLGSGGLLFCLTMYYINVFGVWGAGFAALLTVLIPISLFKNLVALGLGDLDRLLVRTPVVGPVYEILFRKETYFRLDSRLCYLHTVPTIVKELAEEFVAAKGVKLIHQYEMSPIFGELYKRAEMSESTEIPMLELPPRLSI